MPEKRHLWVGKVQTIKKFCVNAITHCVRSICELVLLLFTPIHLTPIYSPLYLLTPLSFNPSINLSRHLAVEKHMRAGSTSFHPYHLTPIYSPLYLLTPLSFNPSIILSRHLAVDIKRMFWHN